MISKWFELKQDAQNLRKNGIAIGVIEKRLGIPRSTLSGWFKNIRLTNDQKEKLSHSQKMGLIEARKKAVIWHNSQKEKRIRIALFEAKKILEKINLKDIYVLQLGLAMLYLGEGNKGEITSIGNSDPLILKFFLAILRGIYKVDIKTIRCDLNLRADQDPMKMKKYWAKELNIPLENFRHVALDKRTIGSKTYDYYKGVCQVRCGNIAIQRELIYLSNIFCKKVIENLGIV